jgi:hypothetical protein
MWMSRVVDLKDDHGGQPAKKKRKKQQSLS